MTLREFAKKIQEIINENPQAIDMEMFGSVGSSGTLYEMRTPQVAEISLWDNSDMPIEEMLPSDYKFDSVIDVYLGN